MKRRCHHQTKREGRFYANERALLVAAQFAGEFSEWDLSVAMWKAEPDRYAMQGHDYPDHKRVYSEITGSKVNNPIRRGWFEKTRPCHFRVTPIGKAHAARLSDPQGAARLYEWLKGLASDRSLARWLANPEVPREVSELGDFVLASARRAIDEARAWCVRHQTEYIVPRGPAYFTGTIDSISVGQIAELDDFVTAMTYRFREGLAEESAP